MSELDQRFNKAVDFIRNNKSDQEIDNSVKLNYYALYKQATVGSCSKKGGSQPSYLHFVKRQKWNAWNDLKEMSSEEAKTKYIECLCAYEPNFDQS